MKTIDEIQKIQAVVQYILQQIPEGVDYIHLFKILYFAQQEHLVTYGLPLMDDTFVVRRHGPVATLTYKVLCAAEHPDALPSPELAGFIRSLSVSRQGGHQVVTLAEGAAPDMDELSAANAKVLDRWIARCKEVESFNLSDMSHDRAWAKAKRQTQRTGEDTRLTAVDIAAAGGATKEMLDVIRTRQIARQALR